MMTTKTRSGHLKYVRPKQAPRFDPTEDDDRILLETYRHDIINTKTNYTLLAPRSEDRIQRRLRHLFDAGFLQRLGQMKQKQ